MRHPLFDKNLKFYILIWVVIFTAHILFLHYSAGLNVSQAAIDSFVFNFLIASVGLSYWYMVKYLSPGTTGFINIFFAHIIGIAVLVTFIIYFSFFILNKIPQDEVYIFFLRSTLFWRGVLAVFYLVILIMIYYLLQYNLSFQQKEKEEGELQNMLKNAELEMLKFQLNPHFIFNSLNSISSLTITAPEKAQDMVIKLSEFLRSSLGKQKNKIHSLREEFTQMSLYLEIEKVRFGNRLVIKQNIAEDCYDLKIPHLILQPIYENAIKYGLYDQLGEVIINTGCYFKNNYLFVEVCNSFDPENHHEERKGIGLNNISKRMELLYGQDDLVLISKENDVFKITIKIPQDA